MNQEPPSNPHDSQGAHTPSPLRARLASWQLTLLFLTIGAGVFLLDRCTREDPQTSIVVASADVERLGQLWESQAQRPPTETELQALIDEHVREEVLVREARRLGLEADDIIIRRRLAQKMSFLLDDISEPSQPSEETLQEYYKANAERFSEPRRTTFQHIFLSEDNQERLQSMLAALAAGTSWRSLGDPFMLRREYAELSDQEVDALFGSGFAGQLAELPLNQWRPSIRSTLGFHIVRVVDRKAARLPDFDGVRTRVKTLYVAEQRRAANQQAYQKIASRYQVTLPASLSATAAPADSPPQKPTSPQPMEPKNQREQQP